MQWQEAEEREEEVWAQTQELEQLREELDKAKGENEDFLQQIQQMQGQLQQLQKSSSVGVVGAAVKQLFVSEHQRISSS